MLENTGTLETNDKQEKSHSKTDCVLSCSSLFTVNKKKWRQQRQVEVTVLYVKKKE